MEIDFWFYLEVNEMKINEINNRIHDLETSVEILQAIKRDYIENNRDEAFINALDDGINYTRQRLETYKTIDWVMLSE